VADSQQQIASLVVEPRVARRTVIAILLVDLILIAVHIIAQILMGTEGATDTVFTLQTDRGFAEVFGYLQLMLLAWLLWTEFRRHRQPVYAAWALLFFVVLLDDSLRLHEVSGARLADLLPTLPGLRPRDTGELVFWAVAGLGLLVVLLLGHARSETLHTSRANRLLAPLALLLVTGVGVDMLSIVLEGSFAGATELLQVTEDGGELLAITWAVAVASGVNLFARSTWLPNHIQSVADSS
jgi:hypothetical protein